jgi:hypothetical protein
MAVTFAKEKALITMAVKRLLKLQNAPYRRKLYV